MNGLLALRAAATQLVCVAALAVLLGTALPHSFFESWGWLAGPATWFGCAAITAKVLSLPVARVLLGAGLSGLLSGAAVLIGAHWLGVAVAIVAFAAWCGRLGAGEGRPAWTSA